MKLIHSLSLSTLCLSLLIAPQVYAQTVDDALRFSTETPGTSARIKAMGDAQTALGGDISAINGNPAGLGFFGRSDISATFNYLHNGNNTSFEGMSTRSQKGNFGIDQAGVVFHFPIRNYSGWQNFNMGISYNKTQNFNNIRTYEGENLSSTYVSALTNIMDPGSNFEEDFYHSNIVEQFPSPNNHLYFPLAVEQGLKKQYNERTTAGHRSKTAIAFGTNYNNMFYIGATLGISSFQFDQGSKFIENGWTKSPAQVAALNPNSIFVDPNNVEYDYLDASYELFDNYFQKVDGSGVDVKLGIIYKPAVDWNIGVTVTSPTWTTVREDTKFYTDIDYYDDENAANPFGYYESKSYESSMDYNLTTPWKFAVGVSNFFGRGVISADAELVTYSTMKYGDPSGGLGTNRYDDTNKMLKDTYRTAANVRLGGEYLFDNVWSGRAGINYFGNPYKDAVDSNFAASLGIGVKLSNTLYMDLGVSHQIHNYSEAAYVLNSQPSPIADFTHHRTNATLTLGAKF